MPWTPDLIPRSQFEPKPSGYIIVDGQEVAHTLRCCHCQCHFVSVRGSGHIRGHCLRCDAITCGRPECDTCMPWEARIEQEERAERQIILP